MISQEKFLRTKPVRENIKGFLPYLGPAFLVSVGYMDPGNWGTDIAGGSNFNYSLLWVLLMSNLMAILLQTMSAKLGIATGKTLAQNCREHFSRPVSFFLWLTAEAAAMATDLAEFLGAALGFYLLFNIPMFPAALLTGVAVFLVLGLHRFGYRKVEYVIMGLVSIIGLAYVYELFLAKPDWAKVAYHTLVPQVDAASILVAVGMLGATVMPHNLFLHSGVIQTRLVNNNGLHHRKIFRFEVLDAVFALNLAWLVNAAILIMSAAVFFKSGTPVESIEQAHQTLTPLLGGLSSLAFAVALLCSGLSSSLTGTLAGQIIIEGFLNIKMSIFLRRFITMIPALIAIALHIDPLQILILSQVTLSLQLPFTIIPLILLTRRRAIMGEYANKPLTNLFAITVASIIIVLNLLLLYQTFGGVFSARPCQHLSSRVA